MQQMKRFSKKARTTWHKITPNIDIISAILLGSHMSQIKWLDETPGGRYYYHIQLSPMVQTLWFERQEDLVLYKLTWS